MDEVCGVSVCVLHRQRRGRWGQVKDISEKTAIADTERNRDTEAEREEKRRGSSGEKD